MEQNGGQFEKLADVALQELRRVFDKMNGEAVEPFLQEILNARRVFLLSAGREGLATRAFAMRLMHLGFRAYWIWDDTTPAIGPGDVLLCASGSGLPCPGRLCAHTTVYGQFVRASPIFVF